MVSAAGWTPTPQGQASDGGYPVGLVRRAQTDVRMANSALLLRTLQAAGTCSRTELVRATGLSKATVSTLVADLAARGLLTEEGTTHDGGVGRPSTILQLRSHSVAGIGVEVAVTSLLVTVVDLAGEVLSHDAEPIADPDHSPEAVIAQLSRMLAERITHLQAQGTHVRAVSVAQTGVIDHARGAVRLSASLGWSHVPVLAMLGEHLREQLGWCPDLLIENDAKFAAVAAYSDYASTEVRHLLFLSGGEGIGAGIISDGRLLRGWLGETGEVGHMPVVGDGVECRCGRTGCWETRVGLNALTRQLPADDPARDPALPASERAALLRRLYDAGDERVTRTVGQAQEALARGLAILVDVLNPQVIVLSGWLETFADVVVAPAAGYLRTRQLDERATVEVRASSAGTWAASTGAALVALEPVLSNPASVPLSR